MAPEPAKDQSGDAVSTHLANKSAAKFVKYYRTQVLKLPEEELVSEFDDGELKFYIKGLLHWVCTTPIPAYSRGGNNIFDQSPSNNHRCIIWSTVEGYIGKYLLSLRRDEKFKNIEDFIGLEWDDNVIDSIPWWKDFKIAYKKKFSTMVSELGSDFVFELQDPVSLYQDNGDLWVESFGDDGAQPQFHDVLSGIGIDGNSIVLLMMIMATELIIGYNIGYGLF